MGSGWAIRDIGGGGGGAGAAGAGGAGGAEVLYVMMNYYLSNPHSYGSLFFSLNYWVSESLSVTTTRQFASSCLGCSFLNKVLK